MRLGCGSGVTTEGGAHTHTHTHFYTHTHAHTPNVPIGEVTSAMAAWKILSAHARRNALLSVEKTIGPDGVKIWCVLGGGEGGWRLAVGGGGGRWVGMGTDK